MAGLISLKQIWKCSIEMGKITHLRHVSVPINLRIWNRTFTVSETYNQPYMHMCVCTWKRKLTRDIGNDKGGEDRIAEQQSEGEGHLRVFEKSGDPCLRNLVVRGFRTPRRFDRHGWIAVGHGAGRLRSATYKHQRGRTVGFEYLIVPYACAIGANCGDWRPRPNSKWNNLM